MKFFKSGYIIFNMLTAELYSGNCKVPLDFRLYHGGEAIDGLLKTQEEATWSRLSDHVFFSANINCIQEEYLKDSHQLYVTDAREVTSNSFVMTDLMGWWYDDVHFFEDFLKYFEEHKVNDLESLLKINPDYRLRNGFDKFTDLKVREDFAEGLKEAKKNWFHEYCEPFNVRDIEKYRKQGDNVILVPGPISVIE